MLRTKGIPVSFLLRVVFFFDIFYTEKKQNKLIFALLFYAHTIFFSSRFEKFKARSKPEQGKIPKQQMQIKVRIPLNANKKKI